MHDESNEQYDRLYDHGNFLLRDRYRDHTDRIVNEFRFLGEQFAADPDNKRFGEALQKLFNDLGNDENGKPVFKKHLVKDITQVIIPEIFENIRYVPIPRIEYSDSMMDAVVENLVIESDNLMPNVLEIGNDNYFRFGRKSVSSKNNHSAMISASGIQCDLRGWLKLVDVLELFFLLTASLQMSVITSRRRRVSRHSQTLVWPTSSWVARVSASSSSLPPRTSTTVPDSSRLTKLMSALAI